MINEMEKVGKKIVLRAGDLIRSRFGSISSRDVRSKMPFDYVTIVDQESEALIVSEIEKHFPGHHIMAEESSDGKWKPGVTWVIDPLDGTTNFIHGFPFVAVSIAVHLERGVELGFVFDPIRGELFEARRGKGAYLNGEPIRVKSEASLEEALVATGFPFRSKSILDPYLNTFKHVFRRVSGIRRAGSAALDLAYLACGRVDGFWEVGLKAWDIAAGALLVREAGGQVSDFWGMERFLVNGHIVAGAPAVYPFLLDAVKTFLNAALESERGS